MLRPIISGLIALIVSVAASTTAHAQLLWMPPSELTTVSLEWLKPEISNSGLTFSSAAYILTLEKPISDGDHHVVFDLPVARAASNGFQPNTMVGNVYIGGEFDLVDQGWYTSAGLRLPLADPVVGSAVGILATQDRIEAFLPETASIMFLGRYVKPASTNWTLKAHVGPVAWLPRRGTNELVLAYGVQGWYEHEKVNVGVGLTGRGIITGEGLSLTERTLSQLGATVSFPFSSRFAGFHVRLPLDSDVRQDVNIIVGIHAGISF